MKTTRRSILKRLLALPAMAAVVKTAKPKQLDGGKINPYIRSYNYTWADSGNTENP